MQSEAELNQLKLEQCCRSHWCFDNTQKPRSWSRIFSGHKVLFIVLTPIINAEIAPTVRKFICSETHTLQPALGILQASSCPTTLRIHEAVLEPGFFFSCWICLHWVLKLKILTGMYESLWQPSASVRKLDGPIAVIQLKHVKWNVTSSSSVGRIGKV